MSVLELLQQAGQRFVLPRFRGSVEAREKAPGDWVTAADLDAEAFLLRALPELDPDARCIGEERYGTDDRAWLASGRPALLVDPLDGTSLFIKGDPRFSMMVARVEGSRATHAWLWFPALQRSVEAGPDGVRVDGAPATPAPEGDRRHRLSFVDEPPALPGWSDQDPTSTEFLRLAEGHTAAYLCSHTTPWDSAPGVAVAHALGGRAAHVDGRPWRPADHAGLLLLTAPGVDWHALIQEYALAGLRARSPLTGHAP